VVPGLVLPELGHEVRAPCLMVLGVVDDPPARGALVADVVQDVGAELAARDPLDSVLAGGRHERRAEIELDVPLLAVTEIVRLLLVRALELLGLLLEALALAVGLGPDLQQHPVVVGLHRLALARERRRLARGEGRELAVVNLTELAAQLRLARDLAGALLLANP